MLPAVRTFLSSSLIINIVDESRTHRHKIGRLFFVPLNIDDYNIEYIYIVPLNIDDYNIECVYIYIYIVLSRPKNFGKSPRINGLGSRFLLLLSF
jgi:hypothetical protein